MEKSFVTSISFGTIIVGLSKLLNLILKILVSRLGVLNFSDYYLATSTFSGLTTISALGIPMSTTRYTSFYRGKRRLSDAQNTISSSYVITLISSTVASIAFYSGAHYLAASIGAPHAAAYFRVLSLGLIGATITLLSRAIFLGYIRIQLSYAAEAIEVGFKFIFTIIGMLVLGWGVLGALIGYTVGTIVAAAINTRLVIHVAHLTHFSPKITSEFLRFALPVSASEIITTTTGVILLYIIRVRSGAETIGFYGAAVSLATLIHIIPQMIFNIFLPTASALYAQNKPVLPIYKTLLLWLCIVVLLPSIILIWLSPYITSLIFGHIYIAAAPILSVLVIAYGLYAILVWPNRQLLDMAGYTKENLSLTVIRVCITLFSLYGVFPELNGLSLANAMLMGWIGEAVGSLLLVKTKHLI